MAGGALMIVVGCLSGVSAPANAPPDSVHYAVFENGERYKFQGFDTPWKICAETGETKTVEIRPSRADGTPIPGPGLLFEVYPSRPISTKVRADIDGDGIVTISDFALFVKAFGACNDGKDEIPCP